MKITIESGQPLTPTEKAMLRLLLGESAPQKPLDSAPATPEPSPKPSPTPTPPKPEKAKEAPEGDLRKEAAKLGQKLVTEGQADRVRAALKAVGAKRVTEVPEDRLPELMKELSS